MAEVTKLTMFFIVIIVFIAGSISGAVYSGLSEDEGTDKPQITRESREGVQIETILFISRWIDKDLDGAMEYMEDPWYDDETGKEFTHKQWKNEVKKYNVFQANAWGFNNSKASYIGELSDKDTRSTMGSIGAEWIFQAFGTPESYSAVPFYFFWSYDYEGWSCVGGSFGGLGITEEQ